MKHSLREYEAARSATKHSLRSYEAKRTFFILHVAKQRFIAEGCFMGCKATRFMHRRCASFPKQKALLAKCFLFWLVLTKKCRFFEKSRFETLF